ncbi:Protein Largen [Liparis tanakae]|uniref:Protein Largen n=1 Tax=Liparis tanakae TaxID=230148 RepID=A0A4Z2GZJ4_9TELE|nr:Protein Largen [Liparis tanakae]
MLNGHCGPRAVVFEGREERDSHQVQGRLKGGSEEDCNGRCGSQKAFFPTEVPQKHLNQRRQKEPCLPPSGTSSPETSKLTPNGDHQCHGSAVAKQKRRQDSVRDQIKQVVTDLEDVLGGLKQVHMEMKEVVQQIDRLTARIDLSEEKPRITQGASINFPGSTQSGDLRVARLHDHEPAPVQAMRQIYEDRVLLRTNSPSPVHLASVVKTSRFTPPAITKDINHDRPGVNGHPPHLYPRRDSDHVGQTHPEPHPQSLDPTVIIGNSTSSSRTQKPPLYPQNGRCGKGPYPPPKPVRTPAYPARSCQSTSMV